MNFSLIVLAGGKSSRMGEDKGLILFRGKPMIKHVLDNIAPRFEEVIIVSNNKSYHQFNAKLVSDNCKSIGPLGGIEAGLLASKNTNNIIVSCDAPFVNLLLIDFIIKNHQSQDVVFLIKKGLHPFPGYYNKKIHSTIHSIIKLKDYKISNLEKYCSTLKLDCSSFSEKYFINFNSPDQINNFNANPS